MILTFNNINSITFPVYPLLDDSVSVIDGLVFCEYKIVDDRNMPGDTLGKRRLQTPRRKELLPLKRGKMFKEMLSSRTNHFIDSKGKIFHYIKTDYQALKYYKVKRIDKKEVASLVWFYGISYPFEVPRPPKEPYASILHYRNQPWAIYEFTYEMSKDTRRMV